ncbi:hypothetical protein CLV80_104184 [Yoonia maritima]|uniref:Uncharacterized protein n=1 Tax=Yoonia maritima TaxID=1435347 RepID=A0A2T0W0D5_9RHOB|nr:hypothetical protein [Yoonia maritima]PRY78219.1 hypothetical protein CLV80_104184 [Yoonia maritima]
MKPIFLAAACAMIAGQAQALSCMRPDPISTFNQVAASSDNYYVLYGTLTFDESALPPVLSNKRNEAPAPISARFNGKGLTYDGFTSDYISPAFLQVDCVANYCGSAQSGIEALYFARAENSPVVMTAGACGGMIFPEPSQAVLDQLTTCMQGGTCSAQSLQ